MDSYDVIVIGGGPSGSTAARHLSGAGLSVLVLERNAVPRVKPCGGALTHRALALLPPGHESQLRQHPTDWTFKGKNLAPVTIHRNSPYCHIVERQYFDQFLLETAESCGAAVHDEEPVRNVETTLNGFHVSTQHSSYKSSFLIAADGAHGVTAKHLGFQRPRFGAAIEAEVEVDEPLLAQYSQGVEIHIGQTPWGYAWVIPRENILNVGVGSFRPQSFPLKHRFLEFCHQILGERIIQPLAHPLPYRLRYISPVLGRTLFVGDAAGFMDAFSAEGIFSALRSGQLAAEALIGHVTLGASLDGYSQRLHEEFWPTLKSAIKLGLLFYPLTGFWSNVFSQNQDLLEDYLDVAMGQLSYEALRQHTEHALLRHPKTLISPRS